MAAEQHGAKVFGKGVRLAGALKTTGTMGAEAKKELSKAFRDEHADFGLPVLEDGLDFVSMGMTSEQAQYLESRKFSVSDIARWFGIPPHMVGDVERSTSWGTGIENQTIQFVTDGLLPWVQLWEESIDEVFIPEANLYSKFNVNARLRADSKTRSDIARTYVEIGVWSPNDVREMEDENPRDGGDVYVTPRSPNEPAPRGGGAPEGPPPPDDDETDERAWLREAIGGLARANAQAIVSEERAELTRLAKQHAKDSNAWRAAVASFYGRWAGRIAGFATDQDAKSYCERRRDSVLTNGLKAQEDEAGAVTSLAALLTAATSGGSNAAA
jgi:hypothetical protein